MNKTNITIINLTNTHFTKTHPVTQYAREHADRFNFHIMQENERHNMFQSVMYVEYSIYKVRDVVAKRIAWASHRPNTPIHTYWFDMFDGHVYRLNTYEDLDNLIKNAKENIVKEEQDLINSYIDYKVYQNLKFIYGNDARFINTSEKLDHCLTYMEARLEEADMDTYYAGDMFMVEKMSNYTAQEDNEFMFKGETTSHPELRTKQTYINNRALKTTTLYMQLAYYEKVGIVPQDSIGSGAWLADKLGTEFIDDNPEWLS